MKKLLALLLGTMSIFAWAQEKITIYTLRGPSGVGMVQFIDKPPKIDGYTIAVDALADSQLMAARLISGEAKIGMLPPNVAAKIAASGLPLQVLAIMGEGMLSLLSSDPAINTLADLRGQTISVAGQGAVPEYVLRKVLIENKIDPKKDVKLDFALAYPEIAASLIAGRIKTALLPQPFATMAMQGSQNIRKIGDIQESWSKITGAGNYPMTVLVANSNYVFDHRDVIEKISKSIEESIKFVKKNPAKAGALVEKYGLGVKAAVVKASVPVSAYTYIEGIKAKPELVELFKIFLEFDPASIGGSLPKEIFYYDFKK
ncbi:hypothetical protein FACS1894102_0230 [Spirochaetia bacterium]|nr:hypothetical protein FACS1894102_0230 [Spirochaetia bacterium]